MGFFLKAADLLSRKIRLNQIAGNMSNLLSLASGSLTTTTREISGKLTFKSEEKNGFWDKIYNAGKTALGWVWGLVKWAGVSITKIVGICFVLGQALWNFDWNQTDESLQKGIDSAGIELASVWGEVGGNVIGTLFAMALGYGIATFIPVIGPAVAWSAVIATFGDRAPEILDELGDAIYATGKYLGRWALNNSYILVRNLIKKMFPNNKTLQQWGNGQRWTISEWIEGGVESIQDPALRAFTESALEGAWEGFVETGFVFARNLDDALAQAKMNKKEILGNDVTPSLELDPQSGEKIYFPPQPTTLAKQQILTNITTFRQVRNRDIGFFSGEPIKEE